MSPPPPFRYRPWGAFVLDKDGTLVHDGVPVPGARDLVLRLQHDEVPHVVLSNTGERTAADVAASLSATLGVTLPPDRVYTAREHLEAELRACADRFDRVLRLGERGAGALLDRRDDESTDAARVCVALCSDGRIDRFCECVTAVAAWVQRGAHFWCTSADAAIAARDPATGTLVHRPGPGVFLLAVQAVLGGALPQDGRVRVFGKGGDDPSFAHEAVRRLRAQGYAGPERGIVMVGDRFDTDVRTGGRAGWSTCLVESGCHTERAHAALFPSDVADAVAASVGDLAQDSAGLLDLLRDLVRETVRHVPQAKDYVQAWAARLDALARRFDRAVQAKPRRIHSTPERLCALGDEGDGGAE